MAITGGGTEQNPWLVHSYNELKTITTDTFGGYSPQAANTTMYIKLDNDINCNDYGESFEWETITIGNYSHYTGCRYVFDLGGYTIKNVKVKAANKMFVFGGAISGGENVNATLQNGKILNVFLTGAVGFVSGYVDMLNISISINGTDATGIIFENIQDGSIIQNCAIYFETAKLNNGLFMAQYHYGDYDFLKNCDIELHINNLNGQQIIGRSGYNGAIHSCESLRITGKIKGGLPRYALRNGTRYYSLLSGGSLTTLNSSCVSIDFSEVTTGGQENRFDSITGQSLVGTVVNKTIGNTAWTERTDAYLVTDEEVINGNALRANDFVVVNVVGG